MKALLTVIVFFVLSMFFTNSMSGEVGQNRKSEHKAGPSFEIEDIRLRHNRQIAPYVPSDIKEVAGQVDVHTCNQRGEYAQDPIHGCIMYFSKSSR